MKIYVNESNLPHTEKNDKPTNNKENHKDNRKRNKEMTIQLKVSALSRMETVVSTREKRRQFIFVLTHHVPLRQLGVGWMVE